LKRNAANWVSKEVLAKSVWPDEAADTIKLKVHLFNLGQQVDKNAKIKLFHIVPTMGGSICAKARTL
jgi:DNA-binding winged helix-turn-helix (wHTH) protein